MKRSRTEIWLALEAPFQHHCEHKPEDSDLPQAVRSADIVFRDPYVHWLEGEHWLSGHLQSRSALQAPEARIALLALRVLFFAPLRGGARGAVLRVAVALGS